MERKRGMNTIGLLGILFVALKLTGYINWSWWLVTLPFWGPLLLAGVLIFIIGVITFIKD